MKEKDYILAKSVVFYGLPNYPNWSWLYFVFQLNKETELPKKKKTE